MAKPKKEGGPEQKLSPLAAKRKARRDLLAAKTDYRKKCKADAQQKKRNSPVESKGKDWDHKNNRWETPNQNRGNDGEGTRKESGKKYKINK